MALFSIAARLPFAGAASTKAAAVKEVPLKTLASFADTLIPADEKSSAPSQLGLHRKLLQQAAAVENYVPLLGLGCQWLDAQAQSIYRRHFDLLTDEQREAVVMSAEASPKGSIPRMFFERALSDLFESYYAHPSSWAGLPIDAPPQPKGYMEYTKKPTRATRA